MKTKFLALSVAAALAATSFSANAALENSWDFGLKGGWAHTYFDSAKDLGIEDKNGFAYGLYIGYNFTDWFGLEAGYNGFSDFKIKTNGKNHKLKMYGPELAARFAYPLDDNGSDIYARLGFAWTTDDLSHSNHGADSFDPLLGVGVQYKFTKNFGARLGYDYYFKPFDSDYAPEKKIDEGMGVVYIGLQYSIGGPAPVAAPAPEKTTERVTENHSLSAGTLFPFDGATLSDNGKKVVADVVESSKQLDNTEFEVYGYTDRIGSDAYNQKLSEKRANAVASELQANGLNPAQIKTVEGRGKANPVTGNKCDTVKGKAKLIDCLAPDRRVEVVVTGDKTTEKAL
ncbi:MAG: OmpA family protein [Succinivibrio sp.]|jgi:OOP family OmpA-OmpF porin|nr:OmpA family protein [Succinivibrio sp.]